MQPLGGADNEVCHFCHLRDPGVLCIYLHMEHSHVLIRKLSPIEEAFTISNEAFPLCVVGVLHLETIICGQG